MNEETHASRGSGFAHLGSLIPGTVTIARGTARAVFSTGELEARLAIPGLAMRLAELVTAASSAEREPTESSKKSSLSPNANAAASADANADQKILNALAIREGEDFLRSSRLVAPSTGVDNAASNERFAQYLAGALAGRDANKSLAFYRLVARTVPREIAQDALTRALDAQAVRKSRAALFSYLVRDHLPSRSFAHSRNNASTV